jgi:hypothetical protein
VKSRLKWEILQILEVLVFVYEYLSTLKTLLGITWSDEGNDWFLIFKLNFLIETFFIKFLLINEEINNPSKYGCFFKLFLFQALIKINLVIVIINFYRYDKFLLKKFKHCY